MLTKFICLANSFKEGGRCVAGIAVDLNNNPIIKNGSPKWIRPVCNTPHGEVPNHIAESFQLLNVIELEVTRNQPQHYQSENVIFDEESIRVVGNFDKHQLANLCDNRSLIFGNKGKAVSQESIGILNHSLMLVSVTEFNITQRTYEDSLKKPQIRLIFTYHKIQYDFPVTDPAFLHLYQHNTTILEQAKQIYLTLSLGIELESWHYKLVAGIIP